MNAINLLLDAQFIVFTVIALVPNLLIILFAMARLSHEVRVLKHKNSTLESDIQLLDDSIRNLTEEFQSIRQIENRKLAERTPAPQPAKPAREGKA